MSTKNPDAKFSINATYAIPIGKLSKLRKLNGAALMCIIDKDEKKDAICKKEVKRIIREAKVKVIILKFKFEETDSSNAAHATAYFDVKLFGKRQDLYKVANMKTEMFFDWENYESNKD